MIGKACQNDHEGAAMVVGTKIDKDNEINNNLMQRFKDHELGLKYVSFKGALENRITNSIRINYFKKEDLQHELLKGVNVHDKSKHECEESSTKETLKNAEVSNKRIFVGVYQERGSSARNALVITYKAMMSQDRE